MAGTSCTGEVRVKFQKVAHFLHCKIVHRDIRLHFSLLEGVTDSRDLRRISNKCFASIGIIVSSYMLYYEDVSR